MKLDGAQVYFHFYVCDVPYPVVSVARLLLQGYKVSLDSPDDSTLVIPTGERTSVVRHGSLLFLRPTLDRFDPHTFEPLCNHFHEQFALTPPGLVAPTFHPVYYHADRWVLQGDTLVRLHTRTRVTLFSPEGTRDRPVPVTDLADERVTVMKLEDGTEKTVRDNWRTSEDPSAKVERFSDKTLFKLASKPTGMKLVGKQSTLPPAPLEPVADKPPLSKATSKTAVSSKKDTCEDLFGQRLVKASAGTLETFRLAVVDAFSDRDPSTGGAYQHDRWLDFPTALVCFHHIPRTTLYVPRIVKSPTR